MKLTIEVPDEYAEEIRRRLALRGYNDSPREVRRVLRYSVRHLLAGWWGERDRWKFRAPQEDGTLGRELPAPPVAPAEVRRQTIMPVTACGEIARPEDGAGAPGRAVAVVEL